MVRKRKNAQQATSSAQDGEMIPEEERLRLIRESGVLDLVDEPAEDAESVDEPAEGSDLAEEIFDSILYLIPFSFLYLGMDIMIKQQYSQHPTFWEEAAQMANATPILAIFIFYTNRYKNSAIVQLGLFFASMGAGTRMIYLVNKASWGVVIQQCPPLGVIWVYSIVQLYLSYACIGLLVVYAFVQYYNLKIIF